MNYTITHSINDACGCITMNGNGWMMMIGIVIGFAFAFSIYVLMTNRL